MARKVTFKVYFVDGSGTKVEVSRTAAWLTAREAARKLMRLAYSNQYGKGAYNIEQISAEYRRDGKGAYKFGRVVYLITIPALGLSLTQIIVIERNSPSLSEFDREVIKALRGAFKDDLADAYERKVLT